MLDQGLPYDVLLEYCAVGSNECQEWFARNFQQRPSRTTLLRDFRAVFGSPNGALPAIQHERYVGGQAQAYTFNLRDNLHVTLGRLGRKIVKHICEHALAIEWSEKKTKKRSRGRETGATPTVKESVSSVSVWRRGYNALRKAVWEAVPGTRHYDGVRLAWHLAHIGLAREDADEFLEHYWSEVKDLKRSEMQGRRYELREARRAVSSAYRKLGR